MPVYYILLLTVGEYMKLLILFILTHPLFANGEHLYTDVLDVAQTIYNEAQGESYEGKCAVATVIFNRAINKDKTYQQVVKQSKQFAYSIPIIMDNIYYDQCLEISKQLHAGTFVPLDNWNMFFNPDKCTPYWYKSMTNIHIIQHHKFGTLN